MREQGIAECGFRIAEWGVNHGPRESAMAKRTQTPRNTKAENMKRPKSKVQMRRVANTPGWRPRSRKAYWPSKAIWHLRRRPGCGWRRLRGGSIGVGRRSFGFRAATGAVWRARRADEHFDRTVAVKLIKRGVDTDEILHRFRFERHVLARLTRQLRGDLDNVITHTLRKAPQRRYAINSRISAEGWLLLRRVAGRRPRSTRASGNGSDSAYKQRHLRELRYSILESGHDFDTMTASQAATAAPRIVNHVHEREHSMSKHEVNELGQPIGFAVPEWEFPKRPRGEPLEGRFCRLEKLDSERHADSLYAANARDDEGRLWTYLPYGPFERVEEYRAWINTWCGRGDPMFYAIIDKPTSRAVGVASYLRIAPEKGSIEVGHINYSPLLQRSKSGTEAMYLMMARAFDLGYRRYEWKCDSLSAASRAAAQRLGFSFEGVFRQATVYKGRNRDTAWYSIIDSEWKDLREAFRSWLDPNNFDDEGRQRTRLSDLTCAEQHGSTCNVRPGSARARRS